MSDVWGKLGGVGAILAPIAVVYAAWLTSGGYRRRRKIYRLRSELQAKCPHVSRYDEDGNRFPTAMYDPIENGYFRCNVCHKRLSTREAEDALRYWHDASQERKEEHLRDRREAQMLRDKLDPLGNWTEE